MSELDLLSKLSRKIFHDLINPASAALNGLELFKLIISDEKKSLLDDEAFLLIEKSASKTLSQLKIYRIAYADITSEIYASIKIEEFRKSTDDFISHTKLHVNFNLENEQISKWSAVILSNIYILSVQLFPQGAGIHIKRIDEKQLLIELESNSETLNFDLYEQLDNMSSRSDNPQVIFYQLLLKIIELNKIYQRLIIKYIWN